ncbi:MAG: GNAT family N-acetyltransferase [Chloroflexota bacterium]
MSLEMLPLTDANTLLAINNAALPDIGELSLHKARWMVERCVIPGLAMLDGQAAGIVVVLSDHCGYDSDFYRWFTDRYQNFLYIDRIVVTLWARGQGLAKQIYQHIEQAASEQGMAIVADVYSEPPNVPSLNLHRGMGFEEVGSQYLADRNKTAAKFMKFVDSVKTKA